MRKYAFFLVFLGALSGLIAFNLNCYHFPNASEPLSIPTYIPDNDETCHPDVLYFEEPWNGWHYWMCHTPYPNTNAQFENPSIAVSNDGINWVEPEGIVNPIAEPYEGNDHNNNYNSDPHLLMSHNGQTMHLIWRRKNGWNNELIRLKSSTDGINWSETTDILSVLGTNPALNETALSPCIVRAGGEYDNRYMLWTVNTKVNPRSVYLRKNNQLNANWSEPILTDIGEFPDGYRLWHMDIDYVDGYYEMIASVGNSTSQEGKVLYLGKSLDGIHWEFSDEPVMVGDQNSWDKRLYRSAFIRDESGRGYKLWYGCMNNPQWRIGYSSATADDYLSPPESFYYIHNYDGQNHFDLYWQHPSDGGFVIGYKVFVNYELVANLPASQLHYYTIAQDVAPYDSRVVLAVKAVYPDGESDPVVLFSGFAISNPTPPLTHSLSISSYPNPFKDDISIKIEGEKKGKLMLYNLKGQLLEEAEYKGEESFQPKTKLNSGIYFLIFEAPDKQRLINKIVKL